MYLLADWQIGRRQSRSENTWTSVVGLEYLELPQAFSVVPSELPAGPNAHGNRHQVVVVGQNFTSSTECVIEGVLTPTRWLASNVLECEIPANGRTGGHILLRLRERGVYFSRSAALRVDFTSQAYVYRVEPAAVLAGRAATLVKVYIADMGALTKASGSR